MKKLIALFAAVAFVTGTVGFTAAQTAAPAPAPEKKVEEKKADDTKPAAKKKVGAKTAKGTVKSASADSVVVAGKEKGKDAEWTFAVDPKTTIKKGGKAVTAADLKEGDAVTVKYADQDGKSVAQTITASSGKVAKKSTEKKEAPAAAEKPAEKK